MRKKNFLLCLMGMVCFSLMTEGRGEASDPVYQASQRLLSEKGANQLIVATLNQRYGREGWQVSWVRQWATRMVFVANGIDKGPVYTPGRTKIGWIDNRIQTSRRGRDRIRIRGYRPRTPSGHPMR